MPKSKLSPLNAPLESVTRLVTKYPVLTVVIAIAVAVVSLTLAGSRLKFRTSRLDLINPNSSFNQLWVQYIKEFGDEDDVVVVVEGANSESVIPALDALSAELSGQDQFFHDVLHKVDLTKVRTKGLHYLSIEELEKIRAFVDDARPIIFGDWSNLKLGKVTDGMCLGLGNIMNTPTTVGLTAIEARLSWWLKGLAAALESPGHYESPWPGMAGTTTILGKLDTQYLLANNGRLGFVLLRLNGKSEESLAQNTDELNALRRLVAKINSVYPHVKIGITGLPVMENDEMASSQVAMTQSTALSLVGVIFVFVVGFGGIRHPLLAIITLLLGMAWSFGYITVFIGHLNILSIAFGAVVIGLGIDFGIHYVARYLQIRQITASVKNALLQTAIGVGPGVITGAVTTAVAFFVAGFTEFTGVAELGIIAGGGILLCCVAAITVLPAMIYLSDRNRDSQGLPTLLDMESQFKWFRMPPAVVLVIGLMTVFAIGIGLPDLWYDYNLLNLQPEGIESVALEQKLLTESDQSAWFAVSVGNNAEELLARKARFLQLPSVERVEEIVSLFPSDEELKIPIISNIRQQLEYLPLRHPQILSDKPDDLNKAVARLQTLLANNGRTLQIKRYIEQIRIAIQRLSPSECDRRLSWYQDRVASDLLNRLCLLRSVANPEPPRQTDLPNALVRRFVGKNGWHLLKVYSKGSIWDMAAMEIFVREVRSVDPNATGNPLQTYEASRQMKWSYEQAGIYALIGILVFVYLDFRSLHYSCLALLPLGLGMWQTFGILGLLNIPFNPANMIVLPLLLGIGVDNGVHIVHDFRSQAGRYRMSASTASSVMLTSLTTMIGFGSLMIASHKGLHSLGRVLTIGVSCCLFTSLIILPALLAWLSRNRSLAPSDKPFLNSPIIPQRILERFDMAHPVARKSHANSPKKVTQEIT